MIPIRDHNPSEKPPYVTYALIVANLLVFLVYWPFLEGYDLQVFFHDWALIPARVSAGEGWTGLLTSIFLHGGVLHLAGNMLFLWIFGDNLEEDLGHLGYLGFYLACGLGAGAAHVLMAPWSPVPTVGASGAIAGVMGGYLLMYPRAKVDVLFIIIVFFKVIPIPAWIMLGFWFGVQLLNGAAADPDMGGVAYWAHAGGFLIGLVLVLPAWLKRGGKDHWRRTEGRPAHPESDYKLSRSSIPVVRRRK